MLKTLLKFLPVAQKVAAGKSTLPILENTCIEAGFIRVTDLETTVCMPVEDDRSYMLPLSILKTVLKTKPKLLEVEVLEDSTVKLNYDSRSVTFKTPGIEEFPQTPQKRFKNMGIWTKEMFLKLYSQLPYCSTDELKPSMNGVYVRQNNKLSSCATDGHILSFAKDLDPEGQCKLMKELAVILPTKSVKVLSRIFHGKVKAAYADGYLRLRFSDGVVVYIRVIDERYPDFESVIPKDYKGTVQLDRKTLLSLAQEAKPFSCRENHKAAFSVNGEVIEMTAEDPEEETVWESQLPLISKEGESIKTAFDLTLLEKVLKSMKERKVEWHYNSPVSANIFTGVNGEADHLNLIMPLKME